MAGEVAPALGDPTCGAGQGVFGDTRIEEARPATKSSTFPNRYVTLVSLFATLGAFLFGLDIGYISGVENMQGFVDDVHNGTPIDPESLGFVTSIFSIGAAIAAFPFVSAPVLKAIGRKWSIFTGAIIFIVGIVIQATANGLPQMFAGRFFSGLAVGFLAVTVPLYIGEIAPKQFRGALSTFYQIAICLGIVVAFWVNVALQYTFLGWRISVWVQLVPCVTLAVGMVFLPYSPRWLLERQRWSEAREVFFAVRRRPANSKCCSGKQSLKSSETSQNGAPNVEAAREFETMLATYRRDSSGFDTESSGVAGDAGDIASALTPQTGERVQQNPDASVVHDFQNTDVVADVRSTRFCSSYNLALLSIGCTLQLLQQLCGMNAFMYYGPQIFEEIGISPFLFTAVVGLVNFGATLPAVCTQDRWGRIALLKASFGGMAACCFLLALVGISILEGDNSTQANVTGQGFATTMTAEDRAHPGAAQITAALSIFAFVAFFCVWRGACRVDLLLRDVSLRDTSSQLRHHHLCQLAGKFAHRPADTSNAGRTRIFKFLCVWRILRCRCGGGVGTSRDQGCAA
eukprot:INCI16067.2.p1 GENE.INCI16067.2~~INCI16067.2.p1  ORF type:complete len:573 (-),score=76.96 INCI16067.2:451-2169(-)